MDTLFSAMENERKSKVAPLSVRMRPESLDDIVGQHDVVGKESWLRSAIENDRVSSVILFGPAGTGKTSLAHVIAHSTKATFVEVSAIGGTVSDLRREIDAAEKRLTRTSRRTILFVDEIHRFNRAQQDALLHAVEDKMVVLVGATTENPFFEVNAALISRSRIVELHSLTDGDIEQLLERALADLRGLQGRYYLDDQAKSDIVRLSGGDGRVALTTLELACELVEHAAGSTLADTSAAQAAGSATTSDATPVAQADVSDATPVATLGCDFGGFGANTRKPLCITEKAVARTTPHRVVAYDKNKDLHYDIISAFIKSMRGSDPDATLYWLARMIEGGEDPKFIARRIFIAASEDVGNADPQALLIAEAAFRSAEVIGYPECRIILSQAATYVALAPKSNAAVVGIDAALSEVRKGPARSVPSYLRDRHRPTAKSYGSYYYPHDYPHGWVDQRYLPEGLEPGCLYRPSTRGWEAYRCEILAREREDASL